MSSSTSDVRLQLPKPLMDELTERACGSAREGMPDEAIAAARGALARSLLSTALNHGALPTQDASANGSAEHACLRVRIPRPLHRELRLRALHADVTVSVYAAQLLETALTLRGGRRSRAR